MTTQTAQATGAPQGQPDSNHFDISRDSIPSFAALSQHRAQIWADRKNLDGFIRAVDGLDESGESGRRKGLGRWLHGDLATAVTLLQRYSGDDVASFTCANALLSLGRPKEALPIFERLSKAYPQEPRPRGGMLLAQLEADLAGGDSEKALERLRAGLQAAPSGFADSAEGHHLHGRACELERDFEQALDEFLAARDADPTHRSNLFHLAILAERCGLDQLALQAYEGLTRLLPVDRTSLMNYGVLLEDHGRDSEAAAIYDTILRTFPADSRARLYLDDAAAGMEMYYDEDMERKEDRLNQILRIPITDFELSVRARNCLNKMNILTLGDLVRKTEAELLSYKNFGETSLAEIKEILGSKGLRLGMAREEAVASIARHRTAYTTTGEGSEVMNKAVGELKLSIRARRTVENLGCLTLGDVIQHSEEELLAMPNFGVTSLMELKNKLAEYGLKIKSKAE